MFRFSAGTEYAIRAVLCVARSGESVLVRDIAEQEAIPKSFLSKLVQSLAHAGVLEARRGVHGGVQLARSQETISILEIIEACEGPLLSPTCLLNHTEHCPRSSRCAIHEVWRKAQEGMVKVLSKTKLSDLIGRGR